MKIGNVEITIEPNERGHSVALIGDYSSNYGRVEGGATLNGMGVGTHSESCKVYSIPN